MRGEARLYYISFPQLDATITYIYMIAVSFYTFSIQEGLSCMVSIRVR